MSRSLPNSINDNPVKGKPGRPPVFSQEERAKRILQAAEQVLTTRGYGAATMEEVARTAGMSKATLYNYYPDKTCLLAAIVVAADDFPWENADAEPMADPLAELRHRLSTVIEFVLSPRQVRLTRLLISEAEHEPRLVDEFHERVMAKGQVYLAAAVERLGHDRVVSGLGDIGQLTGALFGAAIGDLHLQALFGNTKGFTHERIMAQIDAALGMSGFVA